MLFSPFYLVLTFKQASPDSPPYSQETAIQQKKEKKKL